MYSFPHALPHVKKDIGTTLWSFATVEYYDEAVFKAAASELTLSKSRSFKPQELSNTVSKADFL